MYEQQVICYYLYVIFKSHLDSYLKLSPPSPYPGSAKMCQRLVYFVCACRLEDSARHKKQEFLRTFKSPCNAINDRSFTRAHHISYQPLPCKGSATCVAIIDRFDLISPARKSVL